MSLRVRSTVYRNRPGYCISGRPLGNVARLRIFCRTLPIARLIQRLGNDKHIAAYGTGSVERGEFWMRVLDGLLIAEGSRDIQSMLPKPAAADARTACNPSGLE